MPDTDVSIAIKAIDRTMDGFSSARRSAKDYGRSLDELDKKAISLKQRNEALRQEWAKGESAMLSAKKAAKDLGEAYKKSGDAVDKAKFEKAIEEQNELAGALKSVRKEMGENERAIASLGREAGKLTAKAGGSAKVGGGADDTVKAWNLAMAGLAKQVGASVGDFARVGLSSALGSDAAGMVSSVLSGALSGAATGSIVPGVGTALGAAAGSVAGLISGAAQKLGSEDAAFKQYKSTLLQDAKANSVSGLESGIQAAAKREQNLLAFSSLLKDETTAKKMLDQIVNMASLTPYEYDDLTQVAKSLVNYGYGVDPGKDLIGTLTKIGDAGSALDWSIADQVEVGAKLGFMSKLANADMEQLKPLQQRGLNVFDWLAESYGISVTELQDKISKRGVGGAEASNVILSRMATEFGGSMEKQSQTFAGLTSTVQGLHNELAVSMGEGYTARRMEGLQAERDFLEGETGTAMKTVNEIVGQNYATRDNLNDQLKREILNGVFGNGDISNLDAEEAEQVQLLREQWAEASADLLSSDEKTRAEAESQMVQVQNQVDMLIEAVQTTSGLTETWRKADLETARAAGAIAEKIGAYKPGFELSKEMDNGILASKISAISPEEATKAATAFRVRGDFQPVQSAVSVHERGDFQPVQRAIGQHVIPYNNFPILAHQGEMLLTAQEARQHKSGGRTINVNVQTMNVNKSSDLEELARMLAERIEWAEMTAQ